MFFPCQLNLNLGPQLWVRQEARGEQTGGWVCRWMDGQTDGRIPNRAWPAPEIGEVAAGGNRGFPPALFRPASLMSQLSSTTSHQVVFRNLPLSAHDSVHQAPQCPTHTGQTWPMSVLLSPVNCCGRAHDLSKARQGFPGLRGSRVKAALPARTAVAKAPPPGKHIGAEATWAVIPASPEAPGTTRSRGSDAASAACGERIPSRRKRRGER